MSIIETMFHTLLNQSGIKPEHLRDTVLQVRAAADKIIENNEILKRIEAKIDAQYSVQLLEFKNERHTSGDSGNSDGRNSGG